jgi:hypothetical protein
LEWPRQPRKRQAERSLAALISPDAERARDGNLIVRRLMTCETTPMSDTLRRAMRLVFIACLAGPMAAVMGAVTFHLDFPDVTSHTGHYWDDPTYGADARAEIQKQLTKFGKAFAANESVTLTIGSTVTTAFYADSAFATSQLQSSGFYDGSVYVKINTGVDINGSAPDGSITYNFNFGHSAPANFPDFIANIQGLTRHELIHVLGMVSFIGSSSNLSRYDKFLFDSTGTPIANPDGTLNPAANLNDAGIYFAALTGAHYVIAAAHDYSHLIGIMYPYKYAFDAADRAWFKTMGYALASDAAVQITAIRPSLTLRVGAPVHLRLVTTEINDAIDGPVRYRVRGHLPPHLRFRARNAQLVGTPTVAGHARLRVTALYSVSGAPQQSAPALIRVRVLP